MKTAYTLRTLLIPIALLCANLCLQGQNTVEPSMKFGKPSDAELNMTVYAPDPEADAVVLYKSTDVHYDVSSGSFKTVTTVKCRIKILKEDGKEYANVEVPYYEMENANANKEIISGVKATAYNMEGGKVVKTKMENSAIFKERIDPSYMLLKFTVPQVKTGTVIEYQYTSESEFYYTIDTWYAQEEIPVLYTNYCLTIPEYFKFSVEETGAAKTEKKIEDVPVTLSFQGNMLSCNGKRYDITGRNLPAIKGDDFVFQPKDYYNRVSTELRGLDVPEAMIFKNFSTSWDEVGRMLIDSDFGKMAQRSNPLKAETAASGALQKNSVREKAAALYVALKKRLAWNGKYRLFGESANKVLKAGSGSNADLNAIYMSMLNEAGVKSFPVVMSSRDNGRLPITHPSIKKLNTFVVGVMENDTTLFFVDASADDGYLNVLPSNLLTDQAYVLFPDGSGHWMNLQELTTAKRSIIIEGTVKADGTVEGTQNIISQDNFAAAARKEFRLAQDSISYVKDLAKSSGAEIASYLMEGRQTYSPKVTEKVAFTKKFDATADHIYINPFVLPVLKESPFKEEKRELPVEFPYKQSLQYMAKLHLPEGYQIEEQPERLALSTEDRSVQCRANFQLSGSDLLVTLRLDVRKTFFPVTDYIMLKGMFDEIARINNEMIVLKKGE